MLFLHLFGNFAIPILLHAPCVDIGRRPILLHAMCADMGCRPMFGLRGPLGLRGLWVASLALGGLWGFWLVGGGHPGGAHGVKIVPMEVLMRADGDGIP